MRRARGVLIRLTLGTRSVTAKGTSSAQSTRLRSRPNDSSRKLRILRRIMLGRRREFRSLPEWESQFDVLEVDAPFPHYTYTILPEGTARAPYSSPTTDTPSIVSSTDSQSSATDWGICELVHPSLRVLGHQPRPLARGDTPRGFVLVRAACESRFRRNGEMTSKPTGRRRRHGRWFVVPMARPSSSTSSSLTSVVFAPHAPHVDALMRRR